MPLIVTHGSVCKCSFGTAPCNLVVLPDKKMNINGLPVATIMDHKSGTNLATFTLCTTPVNPAVAANNNAPAPCVPLLPSPWTPGDPNMTLQEETILQDSSTLTCAYTEEYPLNEICIADRTNYLIRVMIAVREK